MQVRAAAVVAFAVLAASGAGAAGAVPAARGEYLEARTCNVYTGACHANGEAVTIGREAILAWRFDAGARAQGVPVGGLAAVAAVAGDDNLAHAGAARTSVLYVDARATAPQRSALRAALAARYGGTLGRIAAVAPADITFAHSGIDYSVRVAGLVEVRTTRYACSHCIMPHDVWYRPFGPVAGAMVAEASVNRYAGSRELPRRWLVTDEDSSFVGRFAL